MALTDNLVAYYSLEEASGTRVDATGRGNDLTDNNTVTQAAGKVGNAAQFTRANSESLSKADTADVRIGGDIAVSVQAWIYLDTLPSASGSFQIVSKDASGNRELDWSVSTSDDKVYIGMFSGGSASYAASASALSTATWYHLVFTYDPATNTLSLYTNNGAATTASLGPIDAVGTASLRVGARDFAGFEQYFNGRIDEVGIWHRVLTADERTQLYNGGAGLAYPFTTAVQSHLLLLGVG